MTETRSTRFMMGFALLGLSAVIIAKGVYQVGEDHGVGRPSTFAFFAIACVAAIAPSFYGFCWLGGWRAWVVALLSLPLLLLVVATGWKLTQGALRSL